MNRPTTEYTAGPATLAIMVVREQAPETRLLPIAARPVADHPEQQQVNPVNCSGTPLQGGWTFLVNTTTGIVLRTVGHPDKLDFDTAMRRAIPAVQALPRTDDRPSRNERRRLLLGRSPAQIKGTRKEHDE